MLFVFVGLGRFDRAVLMFRRGIYRVEFKLLRTGIDDVVPHPFGYHQRVALSNRVFDAVEYRRSFSGLKTDKLVELMHFLADFFPRRKAHEHKLAVHGGVEDATIIRILIRRFLNVRNISLHSFTVPRPFRGVSFGYFQTDTIEVDNCYYAPITIPMPRNFYIGLVAIAAIATGVLVYRTSSTPAAEQATIAEFGGVSLRIEYATTSSARERGLGGRKSIAPDEAMLFVFQKDAVYGFWMKDTLVPLDLFWLDAKGHVVSIAADVATSSYPHVFYPTVPARYVLETVAGFARAHHVKTGASLLLKSFPSVSQ
mgnify:CR=1 FL=1